MGTDKAQYDQLQIFEGGMKMKKESLEAKIDRLEKLVIELKGQIEKQQPIYIPQPYPVYPQPQYPQWPQYNYPQIWCKSTGIDLNKQAPNVF